VLPHILVHEILQLWLDLGDDLLLPCLFLVDYLIFWMGEEQRMFLVVLGLVDGLDRSVVLTAATTSMLLYSAPLATCDRQHIHANMCVCCLLVWYKSQPGASPLVDMHG
jgi:hypothetical protein